MYGVTGSPPTVGVREVSRSHVLYGSLLRMRLSCLPAEVSRACCSKTSLREADDGHERGTSREYADEIIKLDVVWRSFDGVPSE